METMSISSSEKSPWNIITWARQVYTRDVLQWAWTAGNRTLACVRELASVHMRLSKGLGLLMVQLTAGNWETPPNAQSGNSCLLGLSKAFTFFYFYHHGKWELLFHSLDSHWWSHHFPCQRQNGEGNPPSPAVQFRVFLYKYMDSLSAAVSSVTSHLNMRSNRES